jgi:hypothetical protein
MEPRETVGASFLQALRRRDFEALASCLHPRVQLRALHPGSVAVRRGGTAVAECFRAWLSEGESADVVRAETWEVAGRLVLAYRLRLDLDGVVTEVEQVLHCDVLDQRLAAIDLLSTDTSATQGQ